MKAEGLTGQAGELQILHLRDEPRHVVRIAGYRDALNDRTHESGILRQRSEHHLRALRCDDLQYEAQCLECICVASIRFGGNSLERTKRFGTVAEQQCGARGLERAMRIFVGDVREAGIEKIEPPLPGQRRAERVRAGSCLGRESPGQASSRDPRRASRTLPIRLRVATAKVIRAGLS